MGITGSLFIEVKKEPLPMNHKLQRWLLIAVVIAAVIAILVVQWSPRGDYGDRSTGRNRYG
jgi:hypothetical protein